MELLITAVVLSHLLWLGFVILGAFWTRRRPWLSAVHLLALVWGIVVEVGPWPCPLTLAELYFDRRAGIEPYGGGFVLHNLNAVLYPNLPDWAITAFGVGVCSLNLGIYAWRFWNWLRQRRPAPAVN